MQIKQNPFTSTTFTSKWLNHFNQNKPIFTFNFIKGLNFIKSNFLPIFINTGQNLTKGISYTLDIPETIDFKKSVILIYDVPEYFELDIENVPKKINFHKIKQYPGYLVELDKYKDLNDYLQQNFRNKTRYGLRRCQKRLELCFTIKYKMFCGIMPKEEYDFIFSCFKKLLEKRFTDKQTTNNNLNPKEWTFYHDVTLPLILEKKASLFVVYEDSNPIAISLNYFSENTLFHAITTFDIDYSKFDLGKIALVNLFSWCFDNKIKNFDFSKGHYDYKTHWMTKKYDFEYHLYYDTSSIKSKLLGFSIKHFLELKQYLRDKELNKKLYKLTYRFKKQNQGINSSSTFVISDFTEKYRNAELLEIDSFHEEFTFLKTAINEFLFLNSESLYNLKVMKVVNTESSYIFKGKKISKKIVLS